MARKSKRSKKDKRFLESYHREYERKLRRDMYFTAKRYGRKLDDKDIRNIEYKFMRNTLESIE